MICLQKLSLWWCVKDKARWLQWRSVTWSPHLLEFGRKSWSAVVCITYPTSFKILSFIICLFVADEKKMVDTVFNNAIDSLSDEDKKLPQVWYFCIIITSGTFSFRLCSSYCSYCVCLNSLLWRTLETTEVEMRWWNGMPRKRWLVLDCFSLDVNVWKYQ